jgi:hypothetical protein
MYRGRGENGPETIQVACRRQERHLDDMGIAQDARPAASDMLLPQSPGFPHRPSSRSTRFYRSPLFSEGRGRPTRQLYAQHIRDLLL